MSELNLFDIKRRLANATPGPWDVEYGEHGKIQNTQVWAKNHTLYRNFPEIHGAAHKIATIWNVSCTCIQGHQYDNQEFIAHAITDMKLLFDEVQRLRKELRLATNGSEE